VFSIKNEKAPGLDGYSSLSFKQAWDVVGEIYVLLCKTFSSLADFSNRLIT